MADSVSLNLAEGEGDAPAARNKDKDLEANNNFQPSAAASGLNFHYNPDEHVLPVFGPLDEVPSGLDSLDGVPTVIIQQKPLVVEGESSLALNNSYDVLGINGERLYVARENLSCVCNDCLGPNRPFVMNFVDGQDTVAIKMERGCNGALCCCGSEIAGTKIVVKSPLTEEVYGSVVQKCRCTTPGYTLLDGANKELMSIEGPTCASLCPVCSLCGDTHFQVYMPEERAREMRISSIVPGRGKRVKLKTGFVLVATITNKMSPKGDRSDTNKFKIHFYPGLDPKLKATLLGAAMAIDFSFFEAKGCTCACSVYCWIMEIITTGLILGLLYYHFYHSRKST